LAGSSDALADRAARPRRVPAAADATVRQQADNGTAPPTQKLLLRSPAVPVATPALSSPAGDQPAAVRIAKLMAERGLCSRRDADDYIARGWVFVDGRRVSELGSRAAPSAVITLDRRALAAQEASLTILLHKPVGYVSGQPEPGCTPAVALVRPERQFHTTDTPAFHPSCLRGLAPAGRLDIDSTGLLVLTQDGRVARRLVGDDSTIDKEYLVRVDGQLDERGLALLNHGLSLDDRRLKPARVERLNADQLRFVLREGRKRQIRRMCELVGLRVLALKRVRIGAVRLADLPLGQWRFLRPGEAF
jgi:23S rRNA pseudouridine2604 synthase